MLARSGKSAGSTLSLAAGGTAVAVATCCVRTHSSPRRKTCWPAQQRGGEGPLLGPPRRVAEPDDRLSGEAAGGEQVHRPGAPRIVVESILVDGKEVAPLPERAVRRRAEPAAAGV